MSVDPQDGFGLLRSFLAHRGYLAEGLGLVSAALNRRAVTHDLSKLKDDEFEGFSRINAAARINKFGSPEYSEGMKREWPTIDLHFSRNRHHPEFHGSPLESRVCVGIEVAAEDMTFLDVIEMVCDWWAARKGYDDPRPWLETVELNFKAKDQYLSAEQIWLARNVADFLGKQEA